MTEAEHNGWVTQSEFRSEIRRIDERAEGWLRAMAAESLRVNGCMKSEADRINALLLASAQNVREASTRAEQTATHLAERVEATAKALVQQGEASTRANVDAVAATAMAMDARIKPLESLRWEEAGRSRISVPLLMAIAGFCGALLLFLVQRLFMHP